MRKIISFITALLCAVSALKTVTISSSEITGLSVSGNDLKLDGRTVSLNGVNIPQFSWSAYGDGSAVPGMSDADRALSQVLDVWECPIVRIAIDPDIYVSGGIGKGSGQTVCRSAEEYQALIDRFITSLTDVGTVVVLDCHAYAGVYQSVTDFWKIAAKKYDENELVIYGLLNEPISDWVTWYEGGKVALPDGTVEESIGIPALIDMVRELSDNVVAVGGIDWAFDLSGIASEAFEKQAESRAAALGMSKEQYTAEYSLSVGQRRGRGIMLDTHIYSNKPKDWSSAVSAAAKEYPVLVGEYNPYFRSGILNELTAEEKAFLQKIFHWVSVNGFSSTSWSLGAEPFLTDYAGNFTAIGTAVIEFIKTGKWSCKQEENLLYQHFGSAHGISATESDGKIRYNNMFADQAYLNGEKLGSGVYDFIIDGDTSSHCDIYQWYGNYMGAEFELDDIYPCHELRMTSGLDGYPDKYRIYASDTLENLYSDESVIENFETEHDGTVAYEIDRPVKYVAFLASGYVRIKEISLSGVHYGDVDGNEILSVADAVALRKHLLGTGEVKILSRLDINRDGSVDLLDMIAIKKKLIE